MAENIATKEDLRKLATKKELRDSLKDVVSKKDLQKVETKPGLKNWLNANWAGVVVSFIALVTAIYSGCESSVAPRSPEIIESAATLHALG